MKIIFLCRKASIAAVLQPRPLLFNVLFQQAIKVTACNFPANHTHCSIENFHKEMLGVELKEVRAGWGECISI